MRPLQLKMTAFGPYRDEEKIDFRELKDHQIFVISGATGSGKTTIFDGICFALYGSVSGEERDNAGNVRSDFAEDTLHTAVELIFSMKEKTYRITRQLAHVKKGNKTATGDKTEFVEQTTEGDVPVLDSHKVKDVNKKLEEIIGLTQDQFKQIVMLPQGEFRKLLTSDSKNKGDILRKIFKTEHYKHMADRLKVKKDEAEKSLHALASEQKIYVSHIEEAFPKRESLLFDILQREHKSIVQIVGGLNEERTFFEEQKQPLHMLLQEAAERVAVQRKQIQEAENFNDARNNFKKVEMRMNNLLEQTDAMKEQEEKLKNALKAEHIIPYEREFRKNRTVFQHAQSALNEAILTETKKKEAVREATTLFDAAKLTEPKISELQEKLTEWQRISPLYEEVKQLEEKEREKSNKHNELLKHINDSERLLIENRAILKETEQNFESATENGKGIEQLQTQLFEFQKVADLLQQEQRAIHELNRLKEEEKQLQEQLTERRNDWKQFEDRWLSNQAYELALTLVDGEPCPVCRSTKHEVIVHDEQTENVSRKQVDLAQQKVRELEQKQYSIVANKEHAQKQLDSSKQQLEHIENKETIETIDGTMAHVKRSIDEKVQQKTKAEQFDKQLKQLRETIEKQRESIQTEQTQLATIQLEQREASLLMEEKKKQLPDEFTSLTQLKEAIASSEKQLQQLQVQLTQVTERLEVAKKEETIASTSLQSKKEQCSIAKDNVTLSEETFKEKVFTAGFEDGSAYVNARLEEDVVQVLKEEIQLYENELFAVKQQVEEGKPQFEGKEPYNIADLNQVLQQYVKQQDDMSESLRQIEQKIISATRIIGQLEQSQQKVEALEKRAGQVIKLYELLSGKNNVKISFERYLQIEYLEQIIQAANERLIPLSNGQYRLLRSERLDGNGKQSGLSLDVYDTYTGQERDVKTLSGGEQFNASLCLALGMSDMIQSFKGNVHMDTMFIDEGFGTLDEEALGKAIGTLVELQKTGRMIGIISHVAELKDTIPATLEVLKTKEGYSHSRFVIK